MPLGEVARCCWCKTFGSADELELNRSEWEYQCRDFEACLKRRVGPESKAPWIGHASGFVSLTKRRRS